MRERGQEGREGREGKGAEGGGWGLEEEEEQCICVHSSAFLPNSCPSSTRQQGCRGDFLLLWQLVTLFRLLSSHLWQ